MRQLFSVLLLAAVVCSGSTSVRGLLQSSGGADIGSCQQQRRLGPRGKISSPGYPASYSNHTSCSWFIIGRHDQIITISFDDLDLGGLEDCEKNPCCGGTWIKLGPTPNGGERVHCGRKAPEPFVSRSSKVWIKFHTSSIQVPQGRGFQLSYTVGTYKQPSSCRPDEFQCLNGMCIFQHWACNGHTECEDKSDELLCACPPGMLHCATGSGCYNRKARCNGQPDCPDLSDELDCAFCGPNRTLCSPTSTTCYDPLSERCDSIFHCENGEDEQGCVSGCEQKIMCASGVGCYRAQDRCDGVPHCADRSDETGCGPEKCRSERGAYLCGDGRCVAEDTVCDRVTDCPDGSDEYGCLRNSMITAAIIGSLFCGLLVVVAVSCSCRLYALRLAQQQAAAAEGPMDSPPLFVDSAPPDFWFREPPPPYAVAVGDHRYHVPADGVIVYGPGGTQSDLGTFCGRGTQRRTRRLRRHRRRPPSPPTPSITSHETGSSEEALATAVHGDSSLVLSVHTATTSRRKVSTTSVQSEGTSRTPLPVAAADSVVSCDDTRPLIEEDPRGST
ncbi:uncharacterized protein LOC144113806 [Amblyomma americanum]